jgi:hypothetical protein
VHFGPLVSINYKVLVHKPVKFKPIQISDAVYHIFILSNAILFVAPTESGAESLPKCAWAVWCH